LPFKKFCELEKISANTFQYWRRELRNRDESRGVASLISTGDNRPSDLQEKIDYWLGVIDSINSHKGSIRQFCCSHGIASGSLHFWEKRLKSLKLTKGITRKAPEEPNQGIQFSPVTVLDDSPSLAPDESRNDDKSAGSMAPALDLTPSSARPLAAEIVEPRSGYRVQIFNGADQPTLLALMSALADSSLGAARPI